MLWSFSQRAPTFAVNRRFIVLLLVVGVSLSAALLYKEWHQIPDGIQLPPWKWSSLNPTHPIEELMGKADKDFNKILSKSTEGVKEAAAAYRKRRGRNPPPGFDRWVEFAESKVAVMIEDLFDQIYDDLNPFWSLPPDEMRRAAASYKCTISIRDGVAIKQSDEDRPWMNLWHDMLRPIQEYLPDVDIAFNEMDETRILSDWETINALVSAANARKSTKPPKFTNYTSLGPLPDKKPEYALELNGEAPYWPRAQLGCPPDTPGRNAPLDTDFSSPLAFPPEWPYGTKQGYVANWTIAKDPCLHPHLRKVHGTFIEPISISTTQKLFPMFAGCKLPMNNEILLPPAMYWTDDEFFSGGDRRRPWEEKRAGVVWRGSASGGRNHQNNWTRFQRHRFVSMMNATQVRGAELHQYQRSISRVVSPADASNGMDPSHSSEPVDTLPILPDSANNFPLANSSLYPSAATPYNAVGSKLDLPLSSWVSSVADVAFNYLGCFPSTPENEGGRTCEYTDPWYSVPPFMPMQEQYSFKYLPDIDGNSYSGRYRGFLRSNSLPLKATIYNEWHDSRLLPWKHFVPLDNTFVDLWGVLGYFIGVQAEGKEGHDGAAKMIAEEGARWANAVLRKEDMLVYVYRLVLEYARVMDERRDDMGYAG